MLLSKKILLYLFIVPTQLPLSYVDLSLRANRTQVLCGKSAEPIDLEQGKDVFLDKLSLELNSQLATFLLKIGSVWLYYDCLARYKVEPATAMGWASIPYNIISSAVTDLGSIFRVLALLHHQSWLPENLRRAMAYRSRWKDKQCHLSPSMNRFIELNLDKYFEKIKNQNYAAKEWETVIEEALSLPVEPKRVDLDDKMVKAFLAPYSAEVKREVASFLLHCERVSREMRTPSDVRHTLFFLGPPGTGKTYLAKQMATLLGVELVVIKLSDYQHIDGKSIWDHNPERGLYLDALLGNGDPHSNKLIFIDEVDKVLQLNAEGSFKHSHGAAIFQHLHELLDADFHNAKISRFDGAEHPLGHMQIILAGNKAFSDLVGQELAEPLNTRLTIIPFTGFSYEKKLTFAKEWFEQREQQYENLQWNKTVIAEIAAEDERQGYPGVRVMFTALNKYLSLLLDANRLQEILGIEAIDFNVTRYYNRLKQHDKTLDPNE